MIAALLMVCVRTELSTGDEFVGPLGGWSNVRRDFGAVGDGKADDSNSIQKALDALGNAPTGSNVLFVPSGTYRITRTLTMNRRIYGSFLGEDPESTKIVWDGPKGGEMLDLDGVAYSRFGRVTWDGQGRAKTGIDHGWSAKGPHAGSGCEHSDEVFRNVSFGIRGGSRGFQDAECAVLRCRFEACHHAGVSIENFNALDWFLWDCRFDHCRVGVTNTFGAGNFHVYQSDFRSSSEADVSIANTSYFSLRGNRSSDSKCFVNAATIGASAQLTVQRNRIISRSGQPPIQVGNFGPLMLLDNEIITPKGSGPSVQLSPNTSLIAVGNRFSNPQPFEKNRPSTDVVLDNSITGVETLFRNLPAIQGFAPNLHRHIIEVPAGAKAATIQAAIHKALQFRGQRPVVHLPAGEYTISEPLVVPAGLDVQIVGDGYCTVLKSGGNSLKTVLRLLGPSRATLRDLLVSGSGKSDGINVENCDQPHARIFMEQSGPGNDNLGVGLLVDRLDKTDVSLHDFYHAGAGTGVKVVGPGHPPAGRVAIFGGASANEQISYDVQSGGQLLVEDIWYEGSASRFLNLRGSGSFTLSGACVSTSTWDLHEPPDPNLPPSVEISGFRGDVAFLSTQFRKRLLLDGDGTHTRVLLGASSIREDRALSNISSADYLRLQCTRVTPLGGAEKLSDEGKYRPEFVRSMLFSVRNERPKPLLQVPYGATDVRFYRVGVHDAKVGIRLTRDP